METILQGLLDLAGVNAALVVDSSGRLAAFRGKAIYDQALCEQVGGTLVKAVDSIQLQDEGWETVAAHFSDGKLLLRSLGTAGAGAHFLAVVADSTLNPSFATVAIRVAANKLKKALEGGPPSSASGLLPAARSATGLTPPPPAPSPADSWAVANTGVSWSKTSGSSAALTGINVADPASAAFLSRCTKELARAVGPMSKVYVQEAVRRISPDSSFGMALKGRLVQELAAQVEDPEERAQFVKALEKA